MLPERKNHNLNSLISIITSLSNLIFTIPLKQQTDANYRESLINSFKTPR